MESIDDEELFSIGYLRVSTDKQAKDGDSLEVQKEKIEQYLTVYPASGKMIFMEDDGYSARSLKRPRMQEIICLVKEKKVKEIYIQKLDRLSRSVLDIYSLLKMFVDNDVNLISVMDKIDLSTAAGRMIVGILSIISQWESEVIAERTRDCMRKKARNGEWVYGKVPLGFSRENNKLEVNKEEAEIIFEIHMLFYRGMTITEIQKYCNEQMYLGIVWNYNRIYNILANLIYEGTLNVRGIHQEDWVEPIVPPKFKQEILKKLSKKTKYKKYNYLYSGKIYCKECNDLMINSSTLKNNGNVFLYYVCSTCKKRINQNKISILLEDEIEELIKNNLKIQKEKLNSQIKNFIKKKEDIYRQFVDETITVNTYEELNKKFDLEIKNLNKKLEKLCSIDTELVTHIKLSKDLRASLLSNMDPVYYSFVTKKVEKKV